MEALSLLCSLPLLKSVEKENLDFFGLGVECFKWSELGLRNE
jgi:hypothetical protein